MSCPLFPGCRLAAVCCCVSLSACLWMSVGLSACSRPLFFLCLCVSVVAGAFGLASPGACTLCGFGPSASAAHLSASLSLDGGPPLSYSTTLAAGSAVAAMVHAAVAIGASALVIDEMAAATITLLGKVEAASLRPAAFNIIAADSAIDFQSVGPPTEQGVAQLRRCGACNLPQATQPPVDGGKAPAQLLPSLGTVSPRSGGSSLSGAHRVGSLAALTHAHLAVCSPVQSQLAGSGDVVATTHPVDCFPVQRLRLPCASLCVQPPHVVQHGMSASAAPLDGSSGTFPGTLCGGSVAARTHAHRVVCSPVPSQYAGFVDVVATTDLVDCYPVQRLLPPCVTLCLQPRLCSMACRLRPLRWKAHHDPSRGSTVLVLWLRSRTPTELSAPRFIRCMLALRKWTRPPTLWIAFRCRGSCRHAILCACSHRLCSTACRLRSLRWMAHQGTSRERIVLVLWLRSQTPTE